MLILVACGVSFVLSQCTIYAAQHAADLRGNPNLGRLMFTPYIRILPMHPGILFGSGLGGGATVLMLFTALTMLSNIGLNAIGRYDANASAQTTTRDPE